MEQNTNAKPVRCKSGITGEIFYTYREVRIDRWVTEAGHYIGNTTMYNRAGTKFLVTMRYPGETRDSNYTHDTLKAAVAFIDRRLNSGEWTVSLNGRLLRTEVK